MRSDPGHRVVGLQANRDFESQNGPRRLLTLAIVRLYGGKEHGAARTPLTYLCGRAQAAGGSRERLRLLKASCLPLRESSVLT